MRFRQRLAWLLVVFYLLATFATIYYVFEINSRYNEFAVDHVERYHRSMKTPSDAPSGTPTLHLSDIPLSVWILLLIPPYVQLFATLLACTKSDPAMSWALRWPCHILQCARRIWNRSAVTIRNADTSRNSHEEAVIALNLDA